MVCLKFLVVIKFFFLLKILKQTVIHYLIQPHSTEQKNVNGKQIKQEPNRSTPESHREHIEHELIKSSLRNRKEQIDYRTLNGKYILHYK